MYHNVQCIVSFNDTICCKNLSESLHGSLHYVIRAVNKIKRNAFDERLFAHHGLENAEEDYNGLFIYTEVRWLSLRT